MIVLFANSGEPDTSRSVSSNLGLHCLPITIIGVSRLQSVKSDTLNPLFTTSFVPEDVAVQMNLML